MVNGEMYIADGDYIRDIEVNDLRNRYTLTKGSTQKMVNTPCVNIPLIHQALLHLDMAKFAADRILLSRFLIFQVQAKEKSILYSRLRDAKKRHLFFVLGIFKLTFKRYSTTTHYYKPLIGIC